MNKQLKLLVCAISLLCAFSVNARLIEADGFFYYIIGNHQVEVVADFFDESYPYHNMTDVQIPSTFTFEGETYTVTSIGYAAFQGCYNMKSLSIPNTVTSIGYQAFNACSSLESVVIPSSVTVIDCEAFAGCEELAQISFPDTDIDIKMLAFSGTAWLNNQPDGMVYAGKVAYTYKGQAPASVAIADGTLCIAENCFANQFGLNEVILPNSLISIGNRAFECPNLQTINNLESVTYIGHRAFDYTPWYQNLPKDGLLYIGKVAYKYFGEMPENTTITIKDGTTQVGYECFYEYDNLKGVTLPDGILVVDNNAFEDCYDLEQINLPNSITKINDCAFSHCRKLTQVALPANLTFIGGQAFSSCSGLTSLVIPDKVTSIDSEAFYGCNNLITLSLPASLGVLGSESFKSSSKLQEIHCKMTCLFDFSEEVFFGGVSKENCKLYVPVGMVDTYRAHDVWGQFQTIEEEGGSGIEGDMDGSGIIDVEDVNSMINIILKINTISDYPGFGDMDGNGIIDVEDVNAIINIILKL